MRILDDLSITDLSSRSACATKDNVFIHYDVDRSRTVAKGLFKFSWLQTDRSGS